tara:strand:+ start:833 stop:1135 length:303 start_codon:yes stop_codon:yes gene_type:complete
MDFDLDNSFINSDFDNKLDEPKVTISKQQRNGRKYWTIVEGFQCEEPKKFIKKVKKNGHCNGSHNKDDNAFQFQGLQEELIKDILIQAYGIKEDNIVFRG